VRQAYARQGLGTQMLQCLIEYARGRGIGELYGQVLADNPGMRALCRKLGFTESLMPEEAGIVRVSLRPGTTSPRS